jgi:hypothetical protein
MDHIRKGMLTAAPSPAECWKHLREFKRRYWKQERRAVRKLLRRAKGCGRGADDV